jgi:large subunit ribosomal protein L21
MYAVIATGGKQYRVQPGQRLEVELLGLEPEAEVSLRPVMLVDGDTVLAGTEKLKGATVTAKVVGETKGEKIRAFTYKNKSNQRKRWGHRQHYSLIEITAISAG